MSALNKKPGGTIAFLVILILGALIGSVIGKVLASLNPGGFLDVAFGQGINPGLAPPATLDLKIVTVTFGFTVEINLASLLGVLTAAYLYRKV